jgi:hypothetical protein
MASLTSLAIDGYRATVAHLEVFMNLKQPLNALLNVCLEQQYSRSINIVGKDDGIREGGPLESR